MMSLTPRQADALRFISGFQQRFGFSPTYDEICEGLGLRHRSAVCPLLRALKERGCIATRPYQTRAIDVIEPIAVPRAPDGEPLHFVRIGEAA